MNETITEEKRNIEIICQQRLNENAEQVIYSEIKAPTKEFSSISDKTSRRKMYPI
jgi:hypothetical protein